MTTIDCLNEEENRLYNDWKNCNNKEEKVKKKQEFEDTIAKHSGTREVRKQRIYYNGKRKLEKMIAGFENECVRLSSSFVFDKNDPKHIPFIPEIIILDAYNETILGQVIDAGLIVEGKKYIMYSSSANQQKKQQVCLLEEEFYKENQSRFMCGLTLEVINKNERVKGCNTGKYLAYTSLIFSKSIELPNGINIDEVVVLPEFETLVPAKVNYLDMERHTMGVVEVDVPVNHMDGAGLFVPGVLPASAQIRGGWIKGCVFPFDFPKFIREMEKIGKIQAGATIKDVWGDDISLEHIRDNVKLILNGSQLKMWKYYKSWEDYKEKFKAHKLGICINNMLEYPENDEPLVSSAYQFYQTMVREKVSDDRIEKLCQLTVKKINDAKTDPDTALEIMGVPSGESDEGDEVIELEPLKACIKLYPQLLNDVHVRKRISSSIKAMRKKAMAGKPLIKGFYNYICPDLYAACEFWFCGESNPEGLIPENKVYNKFYDNKDEITEVCCLRSPHLSDCEHGVRELVKSDECKEWFHGMDTVISTHDLLTKTLQCDVDGDETLITHDRAFIDLVDKDKLPLYYEMKKGANEEVNNQKIKECLKRSFENANIGEVSNALTKYLNLKDASDLNFVRYMTAYNNFVIDYPKSQYMPELPNDYKNLFDALKSKDEKFPYFFKYAKDKKKDACYEYAKEEKSTVNRISKYIEKQTMDNTGNMWIEEAVDNLPAFEPDKLISRAFEVKRSSKEYKDLCTILGELKAGDTKKNQKRLREKCADKEQKGLGYDVFYHYCCSKIYEIIGVRKEAATYLADIEYFQPAFANTTKEILWNCFGDVLYENLCANLKKEPDKVKIRRLAYQSNVEKEIEKGKLVNKAKEELDKSKEIPIYQHEFDWFTQIKTHEKSKYDKYLLYLLVVLYKRKLKYIRNLDDNVSKETTKYVKVYKNKRVKGKVTRATLDNWIGHDVANKGLERLAKKGLIKIEECKDHFKIYLQPKFDLALERDGKSLFDVGGANPIYYYYMYTGERKISNCAICGRPFLVVGNTKTCGDRCSEILRLLNKNSA